MVDQEVGEAHATSLVEGVEEEAATPEGEMRDNCREKMKKQGRLQ